MALDLEALAGAGISTWQNSKHKPKNDVGQEDFLKLMVAQMQNQDPFNPMENGEFLTQIATFTTASGMSEMQQSFKQFQQDMRSDQALRASGLIGRDVLVESNKGNLPEGGQLSGVVRAPQTLDNVTVRIYSDAGELVRELPLGRQPAGEVRFSWDGVNAEGRVMPPGRYTVRAETVVQGDAYSLSTMTAAKVNSVHLGAAGETPRLSVEGIGELSLAAVRQIN